MYEDNKNMFWNVFVFAQLEEHFFCPGVNTDFWKFGYFFGIFFVAIILSSLSFGACWWTAIFRSTPWRFPIKSPAGYGITYSCFEAAVCYHRCVPWFIVMLGGLLEGESSPSFEVLDKVTFEMFCFIQYICIFYTEQFCSQHSQHEECSRVFLPHTWI